MTIKEILEEAKRVRDRLHNPPNAVHDHGIDLTRKSTGRKGDEPNPEEVPKKMLEPVPTPAPPPRYTAAPGSSITFEDILGVVSAHYGIPIDDLRGPSRRTRTGFARFVVVYLAIKFAKKPSLSAIGRQLNKDHTSILHARNRIFAIVASNPAVAAEVKMLVRYLEAKNNLGSAVPAQRQFNLAQWQE